MKISVAWVFDHIDANWRTLSISELVDQFNRTTAEIEGFYAVDLDVKNITLAQAKEVGKDGVTLFSSEWNKEIELENHGLVQKGRFFLVKKTTDGFAWLNLRDLHCDKEGFAPAVDVDQDMRAGGWKKQFKSDDYILEVDNKSITHRPDMWSHRGFAREIAAMLDLPFVPLEQFVVQKDIKKYNNHVPSTDDCPIEIKLKDQEVGKRFAGFYFETIENGPSSLALAYRLAVTNNRPIDFIVDATNYVMLDIGQPMHAFDAQGLKTIEGRLAKKGEKLLLLDDQELKLTLDDYVITDGKKPISLAGVMGGKESGVTPETKSLFLESANFDATAVRLTSARFKVRSEASARFEKSLDPNQNISAITRFLKLLDDQEIQYIAAKTISSLGKNAQELVITLSHDFICARLGIDVDSEFIIKTLQKLQFVVEQKEEEQNVVYVVTVPTFRCSKDVTMPEDLIEEIGRFFGYDKIPHVLPKKRLEPSDLTSIMRVRDMKCLLARALRMREVYNYAFYDEFFLKEIGFEPQLPVNVVNPVSQNWCRLVTSLIPHLLKNIKQNSADYEQLRFFEWGRIWKKEKGKIVEQKSLAGILFARKSDIDFYDAKALLGNLFESLDMDVRWKKFSKNERFVWFSENQSAELFYEDTLVGGVGKVDSSFFTPISDGQAFVFELNGDLLLDKKDYVKKYVPVSRYPGVHRDISMLVPLSVTVDDVVDSIASVDARVRDVKLVDFFQKEEWENSKSLTIGFVIQDQEKTLTGQEADLIFDRIVQKMKKAGATIR